MAQVSASVVIAVKGSGDSASSPFKALLEGHVSEISVAVSSSLTPSVLPQGSDLTSPSVITLVWHPGSLPHNGVFWIEKVKKNKVMLASTHAPTWLRVNSWNFVLTTALLFLRAEVCLVYDRAIIQHLSPCIHIPTHSLLSEFSICNHSVTMKTRKLSRVERLWKVSVLNPFMRNVYPLWMFILSRF